MTVVAQFTAPSSPPTPSRWPHRLALLTAAITFLLILVGGVVTNTGSGLAVPDWPTTFGYNMFTYPLSQMVGGVLYEHSHRLIGSLVGILTVALCVSLWVADARMWVRWLGIVAVAGVIVQGILGGLRVVLVHATLALIHGAVAYAFLGLIASLAVVTSPGWMAQPQGERPEGLVRIRRLAHATTGTIYVQILFGVVLTHSSARLDAHLTFAALVSILILMVTIRILRAQVTWPGLAGPARTLQWLWILQLVLGLGAYVAKFGIGGVAMAPLLGLVFSVAHRLVGGLMLVTGLVLTLRARRLAETAKAPLRFPRSATGSVPA
jgi:cytochrome c oxidase assembly protein subunit 15